MIICYYFIGENQGIYLKLSLKMKKKTEILSSFLKGGGPLAVEDFKVYDI